MYQPFQDKGDTAERKKKINLARKKKSKPLGYNAMGELSENAFFAMNKACGQEIAEAEEQIYELEQSQLSRGEFKKHIDTIRRMPRGARMGAAQGDINKEFPSSAAGPASRWPFGAHVQNKSSTR